jgi:WD40 repeat protein
MTELLARAEQSSATLPETPYVGLVPYSEADSAFFFGREAEKTIVTANLRASRLTLVYGPSGVGKTSLLHAGVVHDLRERVARNAGDGSARAPFAIAVFRSWRDDPLSVLMETIRLSVVEASGGEVEPWHPGASVVDTLRGWTERARTLLVVLDQFEDYFLYHPNESGEETFDAQLPQIVNEPNLRVNFLLAIREDAWAKLDRFEGRIPQLFVNYVRIEHLDREGARAAVEGPIAEYNRRLPPGEAPYTIEPQLVEAVVEAASATGPGLEESAEAPVGTDEVETPFLQLVMERLWRATVEAGGRELTLSTLVELGGAQRIVETHLVDALGALSPREQEIAAAAFRYLVTGSRRRVVQAASDLAEWLALPEQELVAVLERLASGESGRILRPVPPPPGQESEGARYEIFHDVLAEPILEWRRGYERAREHEAEARRQRALRRRLALVAAGLLVLVLAFAGFAAWALHERGIAADRADVAESQAIAARSLRAQSLDPQRSLALAAQAAEKSPTPQAEEALRRALVAWPKPIPLYTRFRTVYGVDFSPNGRLVAAAGRGGVRVSSVTGQTVATLLPPTLVYSAKFSPDGRFLVTAGADGAVRVWRVAGWRELPSRARIFPEVLARAAFSADGRFLVAGGYPGWPNRVWRVEDGRVTRQVTGRDGLGGWIEPDGTARVVGADTVASAARLALESPYGFASGRTGRLSVAAGREADTPVFRTRTRRQLTTLPASTGAVVSPDGSSVATLGFSEIYFGSGVIWDVEFRDPLAFLPGAESGTSFSRDGRLIVSASESEETARVWDAESGTLLAELPPRPPRFNESVFLADPYPAQGVGGGSGSGSGESVEGGGGLPPAFELQSTAAFSPDGGLVATWGLGGGSAQLWQPSGTRLLERLRLGSTGADGLVLPTALSHDGKLVATASPTNEIDVRSARDGRRLARLRGSTDFVSSLVFSQAGQIGAASHDGLVRIWRANGRLLHTLRGHEGRVGAVAFNPEGTLVASAGEDGTARIWRLPGGEPVEVVRDPAGGVMAAVAFSDDGEALVTGGADGTTRVWSTETWEQRALLGPTGSGALVLQASFSRDGRYVATLERNENGNGLARLWRADGSRPIRTVQKVATVAFSPSGEQLLVAGGEATVRILRTSDGAEIGLLRGHTGIVNSARFAGGGDLIVTASDDGSARVWQAATRGTVATQTPSSWGLLDAMLGAGGRLVTVGEDATRLYACEPCLPPGPLRALAEERLAAPRAPSAG